MIQQMDDETLARAKHILLEEWSHLAQLDYKAPVKETGQAIRAFLKSRFPDHRFYITSHKKNFPEHNTVRIKWATLPGTPDTVDEMQEILAPYACWRGTSAQAVMDKHDIKITNPFQFGILLRCTWGPPCGLDIQPRVPTQADIIQWSKNRRARIAAHVEPQPRRKSGRLSM